MEADRSRADDYYLAEGLGVAERFTVDPEGRVVRLDPLDGDAYEAWVAGVDPDTGVPRGRLRTDARGVRFVEVTVNGPKSWSLAAELHPDIGAAYDAAQDRAAAQVIGWLAQHATTRVGPRGAQVQVPVEGLEAVTVRHYTSRAGDPHRHLHLQVNARVHAAGAWRGLHTVGVRDSLNAINGIGTAAMTTDPVFRAALAAHGFTLEPGSGEIAELAPFVGAFSKRAAQIARHLDRYESSWRAVNPGREPGPGLRQSWDRRAWADHRPDKVTPTSGTELHDRWLSELADVGYRHYDGRVGLPTTSVGQLDRDTIAERAVSVVAAARSGWNAADLRGQVERELAAIGLMVEAGVRVEVAEDLTARALALCVPLLERAGVPDHIRALTSPRVLQVEAELVTRLADRNPGTEQADDVQLSAENAGRHSCRHLDEAQLRVVAALAGDRRIVVIEGAAGAGKTRVLAAARDELAAHGKRLVVVTPTLKAAQVAAAELGARAGSVAGLVHQHGWRWTSTGQWTRLQIGDSDPATGSLYRGPSEQALLGRGDLLVVDEAGMLDQDTARALLSVADQHRTRVALVGDRYQLAAVGRGGVLDLAARWVHPDAHLTLDAVHRFTRTQMTPDGARVTVADVEYARLSLAMRSGENPDAVFDALLARGQVRVHTSDADRLTALAEEYADADVRPAVVVDTREQVAELNAVIRGQLVRSGRVDDRHAMTTRAGERIGVDDLIVTRRNDTGLDVANRDTWTVIHVGATVGDDWVLGVSHPVLGTRVLPAGYVDRHVELGYATTAHGVQGDTVAHAHLMLGEHTSAASAYVVMTRGREANTVHVVATNLDDARAQWLAAFGRDRADLGPAHAGRLAAFEANQYARLRPVEEVFEELRADWTMAAACRERLDDLEPMAERLREILTQRHDSQQSLRPSADALQKARDDRDTAAARLQASTAAIDTETNRLHDQTLADWDDQRDGARAAAAVVQTGPGRLGLRRAAVSRAQEHLARWSITWQQLMPDMPTRSDAIARYAERSDNQPHLQQHFEARARAVAEARHSDHPHLQTVLDTATRAVTVASRAHAGAEARHWERMEEIGPLAFAPNASAVLAKLDRDIDAVRAVLDQRHHEIARSEHDPAILALPPGRLDTERATWVAEHAQQQNEPHPGEQQPSGHHSGEQGQDRPGARARAAAQAVAQAAARRGGSKRYTPPHTPDLYTARPDPGRGIIR